MVLTQVLALCQQIQTNIYEYADLVSKHIKTDILVNADIKSSDYYFYTNSNEPLPNIEVFKKMCELQGLRLLRVDDFYFIYDPFHNKSSKSEDYISFDDMIKDENKNSVDTSMFNEQILRYVQLKNNSFQEVDLLLNHFDKNSTYIAKDNAVSFKANQNEYSQILDAIKNFDEKSLNQITFKITILETNLDELKDRGTHLNSLFKGITNVDFNLFVNLITIPYSQETNIIKDKKDGFYGVVSFLDRNAITSIKSSPFLVAKNNTDVYFSSVKNIPYMTSNSTYSNTGTSNQVQYEYRDVGLKLWIKPILVNENVDFDLHLIYDNLLSNNNTLTPITSKKELKSNYSLKKGDLLILSGINQETDLTHESGIPLLKDIWLIGNLFKFTSTEKQNSVLTIAIEVL